MMRFVKKKQRKTGLTTNRKKSSYTGNVAAWYTKKSVG